MLNPSHVTMEQIKIKVTLDGDLAVSLINIIEDAIEAGVIDDLLFCGHSAPKIEDLLDLLYKEIDLENREEK